MEFYSLYEMSKLISILWAKTDQQMMIFGAVGGVLIWLVTFILQGIGLFVMAKNRGMKKKFCAFIPFVNIWYIGKLAGECNFFGQKLKRGGVYAMIAQIVATLLTVATIAAEMFLWFRHGAPVLDTNYGTPYWPGLVGGDLALSRFYDLSGYILPIFQLIVEIMMLILMMALCKKYAPKNYMILSFLVLFMPIARFFVIFALRNRKAIDYEAYVRARHEAYMRQQQQYYGQGNPYASYGRPTYGQNPYGQNPYGQASQNGEVRQPDDEPFAEFSSGKKTDDSPFEEENPSSGGRGDSDGFFD